MKERSLFSGLAALLALAALSLTVASAHPAGDSEPFDAPYLDTQPHTIPPYSTEWYRFEFVVDGPGFLCRFLPCPDRAVYHANAVIRIDDVARAGLAFEVYSPEQIRNWRDTDPVGRGNEEDNALVWSGESGSNGIWYVRLVNDKGYAIDYRVTVTGVRVALSRSPEPTATPWSIAQAVEAARRGTPTVPPPLSIPRDNTAPARAAPASDVVLTIPPATDHWFVAAFPMGQDNINIRLVDGARNGLAFEVYMPAQSETWWKEDPIGRGDTSGDDLLWSGGPDGVDRRLVRVTNRTGRAVSYALSVELTRQPAAPVPPFGGLP